MKKLILVLFIFSLNASAVCVHEKWVSGLELSTMKNSDQFTDKLTDQYNVEVNGRFLPVSSIKNIDLKKMFLIQESNSHTHYKSDFTRYNQSHVKYYDYPRMQEYLALKEETFNEFGYTLKVVGQSVEGRNLYAIYPNEVTEVKKTIVMLGRQHGDEGSQNWIIEGFIDELFSQKNEEWFRTHQILIYPMINTDGAQAQTRYNKNRRDLNRSWHANVNREFDEIVTIHNHIRGFWDKIQNKTQIFLDMHGSFTEDFIYRVGPNFRNREFYNIQQAFIDELASYDQWQAGNFELSSGSPTMARIVMVKSFGLNALTHETPRDIKLNNSQGRSRQTLKDQGVAIVTTLKNLY